ncbi:uncharacterized protein HI_1586-like [Sycon ciliatum]|uniref:uncharacterized protein HI_1586-like n=1 Tax=Sycon ciliatum TaxID=27933 RepID=UPI0031F60C2C
MGVSILLVLLVVLSSTSSAISSESSLMDYFLLADNSSSSTNVTRCSGVSVDLPKVFLSGVAVPVTIHLPDYVSRTLNGSETGDNGNEDNSTVDLMPLPESMYYEIHRSGKLLVNGTLSRSQRDGQAVSLTLSGHGHSQLLFYIQDVCEEHVEEVFSIPAWLSIFPPLVTIILAIFSKQVLVSLCAGIFLGCFFLFRYNPLTAFLHTYDMYLVNAVADQGHAEILVGTFLLGGLIGVVQKSGGAYGLAKILRRLAKTRRSSQLVAVGMCFLVFFDDYSNILIVGNTLRSVMTSSGISKNKFASIIHSMGPPIASIVPISSWIGVEIGTAKGALKHIDGINEEPFIYVIQTIPYRFFPVIMLFFPLISALIGWDFGPMLKVERESSHKHRSLTSTVQSNSVANYGSVAESEPCLEPELMSKEEDVQAGALEPKKGVPQRWFNSAVPFLIVMVVTFVGMILNGRQVAKEQGLDMTLVNFVGNCDAVAALIWSSALATWVALILMLLQKIFTFPEFMEAWVIGVKELLEPVLILISAWALGSIVADVQASSWVASSIPASFKVEAIPVLASILACVMSYATGSAFGTMSILFPLIVPLVGKKTSSKALLHQAGGAIFGGAIFGNVVAPIADDTILTTLSAPIALTDHLKTQSPYVFLVVANTVILGDVMVAFDCYNAYVGLLLCILSLVATIILIGQSPQQPGRTPLFFRFYYFLKSKIWKKPPAEQQFTGALLPSDLTENSLTGDQTSRLI